MSTFAQGTPYGININERTLSPVSPFWQTISHIMSQLRVAIPGIIVSFDATRQVVSVQPSINEVIRNNGIPQTLSLPQLDDIPIVIPRAGGYSLTMPIQKGDECLIVFADMCIDAWWQSGGTNNNQIDRRRHDLSDGFALVGIWNQTRVLEDYSTTSSQLRNDDGTIVIDISDTNGITVISSEGVTVNATGSGDVEINTNTGNVEINTDGGNIELTAVGNIDLNTATGTVNIDAVHVAVVSTTFTWNGNQVEVV